MARFLFWEPYNKAKFDGDWRELIKEIRSGNPFIMHPDALKLIADQLENPAPASRRTQARDGWPLAEEVFREMREVGISEYRARKIVLDRHPNLNEETLKTYCRSYRQALRTVRAINEENE